MTESHAAAARRIAPVEQRVDAIQAVLDEHGMKPGEFIVQADHLVEEKWVPENGARIVAKAWTDPAFRAAPARRRQAPRSPSSATSMPRHHRHLVVLENTATVHNVICCTLCSCTAFTIIGLPPDWYKDLEYRARVVRESRTVLKEMGLDLPRRDRDPRLGHDRRHALHGAADAAARTPRAGREEQLAAIVTRDSLIGVARL